MASARPIHGTADLQGWLDLGPIAAGDYRLEVRDQGGSRWLVEEVSPAGEEVLSLAIPHVEIAGTARAGDEPLAGSLVFGTGFGHIAVRVDLEDDGSFGGFLPSEGRWPVELVAAPGACAPCGADTAVQLPAVEVAVGPSGKAILDLRLPDTRIHGRALIATGGRLEPAVEARISAIASQPSAARPPNEARTVSAEDGSFELRGVHPGELIVFATSADGDAESPVAPVRLAEGMEGPPLRLILRRSTRVSLTLSSNRGPVVGAAVTARPVLDDAAGGAISVPGSSGADGVVELDVPQGSRGLDVVITHPGYATWLGRVPLHGGAAPSLTLAPREASATLAVVLPPRERPQDFLIAGFLSARGAHFANGELFHALKGQFGSDAENDLRVTGLAPGPYAYCWTLPAVTCRDAVLEPGGETRLVLDGSAGDRAAAVDRD